MPSVQAVSIRGETPAHRAHARRRITGCINPVPPQPTISGIALRVAWSPGGNRTCEINSLRSRFESNPGSLSIVFQFVLIDMSPCFDSRFGALNAHKSRIQRSKRRGIGRRETVAGTGQRFVHSHESIPMHMYGTLTAATDLDPEGQLAEILIPGLLAIQMAGLH